MSQESEVSACEECGASVYKEHLASGIARYEKGKLMCSHCITELEDKIDAGEIGADDDFEPIVLEDHEDEPDMSPMEMSSAKITGISTATLGAGHAWDESAFKRKLHPESTSASRVRTFHCKLSEGAVEYFNSQINDWLEANPEITIKFSSSTIGLFEGKHSEPNLIVTVFY